MKEGRKEKHILIIFLCFILELLLCNYAEVRSVQEKPKRKVSLKLSLIFFFCDRIEN